jgi:hypothetical protein
MTNFEFTKDYPSIDSSAVDDLYYNANDNTLVIDWDDEMYRYSDVTEAEADAVADGTYGNANGSVGRAAQALKVSKGQGEYLGNWIDVDFDKVVVKEKVLAGNGLVAKNLADATREYSLQTPRRLATEAVADESPTKEFSLQTPHLTVVPDNDALADVTFTVVFSLGSSSGEREYVADTTEGMAEAIEELHDYISRVGLSGKVVRVVAEFA